MSHIIPRSPQGDNGGRLSGYREQAGWNASDKRCRPGHWACRRAKNKCPFFKEDRRNIWRPLQSYILFTELTLDMPRHCAPNYMDRQQCAARMLVAERYWPLPQGRLQPKGPLMPMYRIYFVGQDDHFHGVKAIDCADDDGAIACALDEIADFPAVEVWSGAKCIGRVGLDGDGWPG
jgi:hypothetical protein